MDSFTQILLGIATAEICAGDKLQRKTLLYGAALGTLPDLDIVVGMFMDPVNGVAIHRGMSHSLLFFCFLSPALGWLISTIEKSKISFWNATLMSFWCLTTHVLLDLFTSWGTQVFWPLHHRIAFKTIFVIDPLYTLPFLTLLIIAMRKTTTVRKKYVWHAIYVSTSYLILTCFIKIHALQQFENALQDERIAYSDLIVKPTAFNCILWNANVATADSYLLAEYSLLDSKPIIFTSFLKNKGLAQQLDGNADFEKLKKISEGWYMVTQMDGNYYFNDLRFGLLVNDTERPQFAFSYVFKEESGVLRAYEVPKQRRDGTALLRGLFTRIKGN